MDYREELLKQVNQLLTVLKQLLKTGGDGGPILWGDEDGRNITLNICLCDLLSMADDHMGLVEEMAEETAREDGYAEEGGEAQPIRFELSERDHDFLRSNGISF